MTNDTLVAYDPLAVRIALDNQGGIFYGQMCKSCVWRETPGTNAYSFSIKQGEREVDYVLDCEENPPSRIYIALNAEISPPVKRELDKARLEQVLAEIPANWPFLGVAQDILISRNPASLSFKRRLKRPEEFPQGITEGELFRAIKRTMIIPVFGFLCPQ